MDQASTNLPSYLPIVLRALSAKPNANMGERREIFDSIQARLKKVVENRDPPLSVDIQTIEIRSLRQTIRLVEQDIRAGINIWASDYRPAELDDLLEKNAQAIKNIKTRQLATQAREQREADFEQKRQRYEAFIEGQSGDLKNLRMLLSYSDMLSADVPSRRRGLPHTIFIIWPLFVHSVLSINGDGRFAFIWLLIQPMVMLSLISGAYFLIGTSYILNMNVPTFAMLGSGTWVMCRMNIFRVSGQIAHNRVMLNFPMVSPIHQGLTQGILYLIVYIVSMMLLIIGGYAVGLVSLPDNLVVAFGYFIGMWICGVSIGFIFGVIIGVWHFFSRLAGAVERVIQMFSSVFYVTEQFPEAYRKYVLWNPLAHGNQLLRGAYFDAYPCTDASPAYFWLAVVGLASFAAVLEAWFRRYIQPA